MKSSILENNPKMFGNIVTVLLICQTIPFCESLPNWMLRGMNCQTKNDCPFNYCCALGFTRFSFPQCMPLGQIGSWCRVYNEPENKTLIFPNGQSYEFSDIYTQFCPCSEELTCEEAKCVSKPYHINAIYKLYDEYY